MLDIGPHHFSDDDVVNTLEAGWALFDALELGLDGEHLHLVAPHRAAAEAVLDTAVAGEVTPAEALPEVWGAWRAAMAALRRAGAFGPDLVGSVVSVFTSDGGVPKLERDELVVGFAGAEGDRQDNRRHHGRPFQAICLWSVEVIDEFRAQGHPLAPGLAGENITVTGLPWERVRPGVLLRIGDVELEVSAYAVPCSKNAGWFTDGHFGLMHHRNGPVSRIYATVLHPGTVRPGDPVLLTSA